MSLNDKLLKAATVDLQEEALKQFFQIALMQNKRGLIIYNLLTVMGLH
jgi:hypothetical protein